VASKAPRPGDLIVFINTGVPTTIVGLVVDDNPGPRVMRRKPKDGSLAAVSIQVYGDELQQGRVSHYFLEELNALLTQGDIRIMHAS
tara:strand:- start:200 stop:460 length:261 start_codon:yes stop_codon:yes gene_type:complete